AKPRDIPDSAINNHAAHAAVARLAAHEFAKKRARTAVAHTVHDEDIARLRFAERLRHGDNAAGIAPDGKCRTANLQSGHDAMDRGLHDAHPLLGVGDCGGIQLFEPYRILVHGAPVLMIARSLLGYGRMLSDHAYSSIPTQDGAAYWTTTRGPTAL